MERFSMNRKQNTRLFYLLFLSYLIYFTLIKLLTSSSLEFQNSVSNYIDFIFLNHNSFNKYNFDKMNFPFMFIFIMQILLLVYIHTKDLIITYNYHLLELNKFSTLAQYFIQKTRNNFSFVSSMFLLDTLSLFVCLYLFSNNMFNDITIPATLLAYLLLRHLFIFLICMLVLPYKFKNNVDIIIPKILIIITVITLIEIMFEVNFITFSLVNFNYAYLLIVTVCLILLPFIFNNKNIKEKLL